MKTEKIIVYTDGGSRGNPGPAAIGVVICDEKGNAIKKYSKSIGIRTNNEAEYEAVIFALGKMKQLFGKEKVQDIDIEIRMDSELVARQLSGLYKIEEEKLFPLFIKIWNLKMDFGNISFVEIPREKNTEADRILNEELDNKLSQSRLL
ncbi:MAG: hypothetical protein COY22_01320 [Candidatus Tagabacteria bacterium CG_4_10_14_0_2_um_filter_40_13]|uniref:RNase H type-1 domain-containing protein n=3 Tax=Candidatus Tagaibacteriota TaxID=1817918 RepID=A0A2M8G8I7_9BACT|nr:MAG: hypothetical protein COV90_01840 [Candidatus Tagabacteria bacterium CG11_big_fil_rev_8_21_14_0_20_41_11]PIU99650.1 MAG: hypothetical protein COS58_01210 [Candidatus Tagabacteria bacterium CG03_land_8_20_14_0_80_41_22]PIZ56398.1 MAG: hypothetical protein COY22_01320 [Candidatus Tagabacteria bacterium CG_4_10_14_0_2_um_filter_40_13]PJC25127.1 MAG: hypothetical protein CO056_02045 [Candidatus Tagabacteria bacterium CG_4_9_14_0_2_um_filter_41_11]PJC69698.1 MAG: hypothetical protein CO014_02